MTVAFTSAETPFLQAILDHPHDPAARLVFADWLEERGDPRGELIRIQDQLRVAGDCGFDERRMHETRLNQLLSQHVAPVGPFSTNSIGIKLALIPAGEFLMGSPVSEKDRFEDEGQAPVVISEPFVLSVYVVTRGQYQSVVGSLPEGQDCHRSAPQLVEKDRQATPVTNVSWKEAAEFCQILNSLATESEFDLEYSLPTEAQWEYACRAGTTTPFHVGDKLNAEHANFRGFHHDDDGSKTTYGSCPVGNYPPNANGLYEMHGNVSELCQDGYRHNLPGGADPLSPPENSLRVHRGGSWCRRSGADSDTQFCRSACRSMIAATSRRFDVGFRVAAKRRR